MILNLLKEISESLEKKNISYMLSGSLAFNSYAVPRMTLDIDFVINLKEENLQDFLSIFGDNYYINKKTVLTEIKRSGMFNVINHDTGLKVDFIILKNTIYRKHEFSNRKKIRIADFDVWIVSAEDLVISKFEWIQQLQSDKQISDIKNLLAISTINKIYISDWCKKLNLKTFGLI